VILFFTPWLFGFTADTATSWVSWIAGVVVVGVSGLALLAERPQQRVTG
jgi:cyanate permease